MLKVDANRPVPLYLQLREMVRQEILSGVRKPGEQLPTEKELEQSFTGLPAADLSGRSLYEHLQVHYGVSIMAGRKMVEGVQFAQGLHIPEGGAHTAGVRDEPGPVRRARHSAMFIRRSIAADRCAIVTLGVRAGCGELTRPVVAATKDNYWTLPIGIAGLFIEAMALSGIKE